MKSQTRSRLSGNNSALWAIGRRTIIEFNMAIQANTPIFCMIQIVLKLSIGIYLEDAHHLLK